MRALYSSAVAFALAALLLVGYTRPGTVHVKAVPPQLLRVVARHGKRLIIGMFAGLPPDPTGGCSGSNTGPYGEVCDTCRPANTSEANPCKTMEYCSDTGCTWYGCTHVANPEDCCTNCTYNGDTDCVGCQNTDDCMYEQ